MWISRILKSKNSNFLYSRNIIKGVKSLKTPEKSVNRLTVSLPVPLQGGEKELKKAKESERGSIVYARSIIYSGKRVIKGKGNWRRIIKKGEKRLKRAKDHAL